MYIYEYAIVMDMGGLGVSSISALTTCGMSSSRDTCSFTSQRTVNNVRLLSSAGVPSFALSHPK